MTIDSGMLCLSEDCMHEKERHHIILSAVEERPVATVKELVDVTGENGGAAFVLIYLACAFLIGMPILMAELLIGRRGKGSPTTAMVNNANESGRPALWRFVGGMGLLAAYTIEIVYAVVVGWVLW